MMLIMSHTYMIIVVQNSRTVPGPSLALLLLSSAFARASFDTDAIRVQAANVSRSGTKC